MELGWVEMRVRASLVGESEAREMFDRMLFAARLSPVERPMVRRAPWRWIDWLIQPMWIVEAQVVRKE